MNRSLSLAGDRPRDLVEPDVAAVRPALLRDALRLADVELEHVVTVLALEPAGDLARQQGEEGAIEVDDPALGVDHEVAVDDRARDPLELCEELLESRRRVCHGDANVAVGAGLA
jgi:hypothetical protein